MELKVVELFAGVGGFRVGLNHIKGFDESTGLANEENGSWDFVWANQWEPATKIQPAHDVYITRFGKDSCCNIDINKVDKTTIPEHSLLVGGFPCQDYSGARSLQNEQGIKGKKGVLWWDIVDVLIAKKTPFILLENVDRLLKSPSTQKGRDFAIILKTLGNLGYIVQWRVINAGEYAMPQRRRRTFIFAALKNTKYGQNIANSSNHQEYLITDGFFNDVFPVNKPDSAKIKEKSLSEFKDIVDVSDNYKDKKFLTAGLFVDDKVINFDATAVNNIVFSLQEIVTEAQKHCSNSLIGYAIAEDALDKWKYMKGAKKLPRTRSNGTKYFYTEGPVGFPDSLDRPARTMLTSEGLARRTSHVIFDSQLNKIRTITEIEAELLNMFPVNWTNLNGVTKRQRYIMMGNALVTGIINKLENKLKTVISNQ